MPALSILSRYAHQDASGDFWYVDGQIQNLTKRPLTNVQVVLTWFDSGGTAIDTDIELVDLKQLLPGQVSNYRTATRARRGMSRFDIVFQSEVGLPLLTRGDSQGLVDTAPSGERDTSRAMPTSGAPSAESLPSR